MQLALKNANLSNHKQGYVDMRHLSSCVRPDFRRLAVAECLSQEGPLRLRSAGVLSRRVCGNRCSQMTGRLWPLTSSRKRISECRVPTIEEWEVGKGAQPAQYLTSAQSGRATGRTVFNFRVPSRKDTPIRCALSCLSLVLDHFSTRFDCDSRADPIPGCGWLG